jgi:hypothetical protein
MNSVKYLQGISFLHLTLAKKTKIKNLCCAAPDLVISLITKQKTSIC